MFSTSARSKKSASSPPPSVHQLMIGSYLTFLEKEEVVSMAQSIEIFFLSWNILPSSDSARLYSEVMTVYTRHIQNEFRGGRLAKIPTDLKLKQAAENSKKAEAKVA